MEKNLLILVSWTILLLGAISFTSCDDDDDVEESTISAVFDKYKNESGALIDNCDVVLIDSFQISLYHFTNDKLEKEYIYEVYDSNEAAQEVYNIMKNSKEISELKIEGKYISYHADYDLKSLPKDQSKQDFFNLLSGDYNNVVIFED